MKRHSSRTAILLAATATAAIAPFALGFGGGAPGGGAGPGAARGGGGGRGGAVEAPPPRPNPLPPFYDPKLPLQKRIDDLLSALSLDEKVSLMGMNSPAIPRLGIAAYRWWNEALHGLANGTATVFPNPSGLAAAWDAPLQHQLAATIGREGRARHAASGSGLDFWAPNINIARDPRWGRAQETYGEDPYLTGRLAVAFVTGMQGDDPFYFQAISTPKHFAVHSGPEPDRHSMNMVITDQDLYTTYLPNFEAAVREGHCFSIMSAYSALDGIPDSGNHRLLTDILRDQWGFKGYVVSDVDSVGDIWRATSHHYTTTNAAASALAIKAGNDLCSGSTYAGGNGGPQGGAVEPGPSAVAKAITQGLLTEKEVDTSLRRILEARFRMGEFDPAGYEGNPYNKITADMIDTDDNNALARKVADESMVLLKNANHTLPLKTSVGTIAVMGPNANALSMQNGNYSGQPSAQHRISILDGIRNAVGAEHVITANQTVPIAGNIALAETINPDYLFTDASKTKHGLTLRYNAILTAAEIQATSRLPPEEVAETGALLMSPSAASVLISKPYWAAHLTGILIPPATGEYTIGGKGQDVFRILIDGKLVVDQSLGGPMRTASALVSLEKDKAYNIQIFYAHTPTSAVRASWYGGPLPTINPDLDQSTRGGAGVAAPPAAPAAPGEGVAGAPGAAPGRGAARGGRGRGGPQTYGTTPDAPGVTAAVAPAAQEPLFQLAWTQPTADGLPAMVNGTSLYVEAVDLAKKADAIVLVIGLDSTQEGEELDRPTIELPQIQDGLIRAVTKAAGNKPVILVNCSGSAVALNWADEHVPAILQAWYPGQRGDAIADVLFGTTNPAGRLPMTFYKSTADLPAFIDYNMAARTYRYFDKPVLYPFGHGLSYSTFAYSNLTASAKSATGDDIKVSATIKNASSIDGEEVVQCYLNRDLPPIDPKSLPDPSKMSDEQATLAATPRKALVGFTRVALKAGESKTITFTITTQQLSLVIGKDGKREVRPGTLQLQIGGSSALAADTLTQALTLEGPAKAPEYHFVAPVVR